MTTTDNTKLVERLTACSELLSELADHFREVGQEETLKTSIQLTLTNSYVFDLAKQLHGGKGLDDALKAAAGGESPIY